MQDPLAMMLLEGKFNEGDTIQVNAKDGAFVFTKVPSAAPVAAAAG